MGTNTKLIGFPLLVMFLLTMINVGGFTSSSSEEIYVTRPVDNWQRDNVKSLCDNYYDGWGENPNDWLAGGDWNAFVIDAFRVDGADLLLVLFDGDISEWDGEWAIMDDMWSYMGDIYNELTVRIDDNSIERFISVDPVALREWEELNASSFRTNDTLVYIAIFFGIIVLVGIVGIRIFGTGIAEISILFIVKITMFLLLWGILSVTGGGTIADIPVIGTLVWGVFTFVYAMGVFLTLTTGGDE